MMASEFSKSLYQSIWTKGKFTSEDYGTGQLDAVLQEVREVLFEVIREHDDPMSEYGCTTHTCQRARALMEKLELK
jgi:hypothetical protein